MYRIAVCDDDEFFLDKIIKNVTNYLEKEKMHHDIVKYQAGLALISDIENHMSFDIYILDIEMAMYSGIDITKVIALYDSSPIVIFVTSHLKYAIDSYNYNIFRFIPKTELNERLGFALNAAFSKLTERNAHYYCISNNRRYEKVLYKDIFYIYKDGKNSVFVLPESEIKVRKSLNKVFDELGSDDFIFVDRCTILNIQMINEINYEMAKVVLKNGKNIYVARMRIKELKMELNVYWGKHV